MPKDKIEGNHEKRNNWGVHSAAQPKEALVFSCQQNIPKWGNILSENKAARLQKQSALTLPYTRKRPWLGGYHV